jgi:hypothetical protein
VKVVFKGVLQVVTTPQPMLMVPVHTSCNSTTAPGQWQCTVLVLNWHHRLSHNQLQQSLFLCHNGSLLSIYVQTKHSAPYDILKPVAAGIYFASIRPLNLQQASVGFKISA